MALNVNIRKLREDKHLTQQQLQEFQKKLLGFIQLVGSVFMAVTVLLRLKAHMSVPVWFTVSCFCAVGGALFFYWVTDRKLKNAERL